MQFGGKISYHATRSGHLFPFDVFFIKLFMPLHDILLGNISVSRIFMIYLIIYYPVTVLDINN